MCLAIQNTTRKPVRGVPAPVSRSVGKSPAVMLAIGTHEISLWSSNCRCRAHSRGRRPCLALQAQAKVAYDQGSRSCGECRAAYRIPSSVPFLKDWKTWPVFVAKVARFLMATDNSTPFTFCLRNFQIDFRSPSHATSIRSGLDMPMILMRYRLATVVTG